MVGGGGREKLAYALYMMHALINIFMYQNQNDIEHNIIIGMSIEGFMKIHFRIFKTSKASHLNSKLLFHLKQL